MISLNKPLSIYTILCISIIIRIVQSLLVVTYFNPDEYWQNQEIAYGSIGTGYSTWEWHPWAKIRSYVHPFITSVLYQFLVYIGMDTTWLIAWSPRILQALWCGIADTFFYALMLQLGSTTQHITFSSSPSSSSLQSNQREYNYDTITMYNNTNSTSYHSIFALLSWFLWQILWFSIFCYIRPFSNSIETCLTIIALYYWPYINYNHKTTLSFPYLSCFISLSLTAFACILRPTSAILWIPLALHAIYTIIIHPLYTTRVKISGIVYLGLIALFIGIISISLLLQVDTYNYSITDNNISNDSNTTNTEPINLFNIISSACFSQTTIDTTTEGNHETRGLSLVSCIKSVYHQYKNNITLSLYNFYLVNKYYNIAALYGVHPALFSLVVSIPVTLGPFLPFLLLTVGIWSIIVVLPYMSTIQKGNRGGSDDEVSLASSALSAPSASSVTTLTPSPYLVSLYNIMITYPQRIFGLYTNSYILPSSIHSLVYLGFFLPLFYCTNIHQEYRFILPIVPFLVALCSCSLINLWNNSLFSSSSSSPTVFNDIVNNPNNNYDKTAISPPQRQRHPVNRSQTRRKSSSVSAYNGHSSDNENDNDDVSARRPLLPVTSSSSSSSFRHQHKNNENNGSDNINNNISLDNNNKYRHTLHSYKYYIIIIFIINFIMVVYFTQYHQSGPISIINHIINDINYTTRIQYNNNNNNTNTLINNPTRITATTTTLDGNTIVNDTTIDAYHYGIAFMTSCHSAPGQSFFHFPLQSMSSSSLLQIIPHISSPDCSPLFYNDYPCSLNELDQHNIYDSTLHLPLVHPIASYHNIKILPGRSDPLACKSIINTPDIPGKSYYSGHHLIKNIPVRYYLLNYVFHPILAGLRELLSSQNNQYNDNNNILYRFYTQYILNIDNNTNIVHIDKNDIIALKDNLVLLQNSIESYMMHTLIYDASFKGNKTHVTPYPDPFVEDFIQSYCPSSSSSSQSDSTTSTHQLINDMPLYLPLIKSILLSRKTSNIPHLYTTTRDNNNIKSDNTSLIKHLYNIDPYLSFNSKFKTVQSHHFPHDVTHNIYYYFVPDYIIAFNPESDQLSLLLPCLGYTKESTHFHSHTEPDEHHMDIWKYKN